MGHLLLHGLGQRYDFAHGHEEIIAARRPAGDAGRGHCRDDALLDLGPGPAFGAGHHQVQGQSRRVDAPAREVNAEDLQPLVLVRQIDEEDLVEAALADHLRGQQVDAVRGGGDEYTVGLLLHPGEEVAEDAVEHAAGILVGTGDAVLDLVEPDYRGGHFLHGPAGLGEEPLGVTQARGEDLGHVHAVEGQAKHPGHRPGGEALAAARDAHQHHALGHDLGGDALSRVEQFAALLEPGLEHREPADLVHAADVGHEFHQPGAADQQPLLLLQQRDDRFVELAVLGIAETQGVTGLVEAQALHGPAEHVDRSLAHGLAGSEHLSLHAQQVLQLEDVGHGQADVSRLALDLRGDELDR